MISQATLSTAIARAIPALHNPLHTPECEQSIYKQVDVLSHYVADKACDNELGSVKRALSLLDNLHQQGNTAVQRAVENVFVFSLSTTLTRLGARRERLLALMPITLFTFYMNQVMHKGC